ncbi:hypothetical protein AB0D80_18865 [Streptomyces tendae]|uniref:hypothetical protein n=1 Tax=Streptomyces tendae TaxID=1932 RepID=UPI0033DDC262
MTGGARIAPVADDDHLPAAALWVDWGFAFDDVRCDSGLLTRPARAVQGARRAGGCQPKGRRRHRG